MKVCGGVGFCGMTNGKAWQGVGSGRYCFQLAHLSLRGFSTLSSSSRREGPRGLAISFPAFCIYSDWTIQRLQLSLSCCNKKKSFPGINCKVYHVTSYSELCSDFPLELNPTFLRWEPGYLLHLLPAPIASSSLWLAVLQPCQHTPAILTFPSPYHIPSLSHFKDVFFAFNSLGVRLFSCGFILFPFVWGRLTF